jgi:hypothetical protein
MSFLSAGGTAQSRYERLRRYVLEDPARRPRTSPAQFDLHRFKRFGLLGLVDGIPRRSASGDFEIQLVPLGAEDAEQRLARLCALLGGLITGGQGDQDATHRTLRQGLDGPAGEGADDPEPACRRHALR